MIKATYKNKEYPNITALCNRFGVNYSAFRGWCSRHGIIDYGFGLALYRRTKESKQRIKEHRLKREQNECITN